MNKLNLISNLVFILFSSLVNGQTNQRNISQITNEDLFFLNEWIGDKRVVLLGEQTHFDGATFDLKAKIVKYLHEEMDFKVLAFESGYFECEYGNQQLSTGNSFDEVLPLALQEIWGTAKPIQTLSPLFQGENRMILAGFDGYFSGPYSRDYLLPAFKKYLKDSSNDFLSQPEVDLLEEYIYRTYMADLELDKRSYNQVVGLLERIIQILSTEKPRNETNDFWKQTFHNFLKSFQQQTYESNGGVVVLQNPRDSLLAENLTNLLDQYPDEKIICWGASYHFAKDLSTVLVDTITRQYVEKMSQQFPTEVEDEIANLNTLTESTPMAKILAEQIGKENIFSIAFTAYQGTYGDRNNNMIYQVLTPPPGSLEQKKVDQSKDYGFFLLESEELKQPIHASILGYLPIKANWSKAFDATLLIKEMYPVEYLDIKIPKDIQKSEDISQTYRLKGRIIDQETKEPVPFAHIHTNEVNAISNEDGLFYLKLLQPTNSATLNVTSIGYESKKIDPDQISIDGEYTIELKAASFEIEEVIVREKRLNAKEIIEEAITRIPKNYLQVPYNAELFYRNQSNFGEASKDITNEAIVLLYDNIGYYKEQREAVTKRRFLEVKAARNIQSDSVIKDVEWDRFWLYDSWDNDPILIVNSPLTLNRLKHYEFTLLGSKGFGDRRVFEIDFNCTNPNIFTAGYASLQSYSGKIFIDTEDYAVVRFEADIFQTPTEYTSKKAVKRFGQPYRFEPRYKDIYQYRKVGGHYLLDYSKNEGQFGFFNPVTNEKISSKYEMEEIQVLNSSTENITRLEESLTQTDGEKVYDPDFWNNLNVVLKSKIK